MSITSEFGGWRAPGSGCLANRLCAIGAAGRAGQREGRPQRSQMASTQIGRACDMIMRPRRRPPARIASMQMGPRVKRRSIKSSPGERAPRAWRARFRPASGRAAGDGLDISFAPRHWPSSMSLAERRAPTPPHLWAATGLGGASRAPNLAPRQAHALRTDVIVAPGRPLNQHQWAKI